jgi:hypothetical protein
MRREAVDKMGQEASEFISSKELVRAEWELLPYF